MTSNHLFSLIEGGDLFALREYAEKLPHLHLICDGRGDSLLHRAASRGSADMCCYLIDKGCSLAMPGENGASPVHYAAARGDQAIMGVLLEAKPSRSPTNSNGMTPMHVASGFGHLALVRMLAEYGAKADATDKYGRWPVHYAAGAGQLPVVQYLAGENPRTLCTADGFGQTVMHWALMFEQMEMVMWLIGQGADIFVRDLYGRSPVFFAHISKPDLRKLVKYGIVASQAQPLAEYHVTPLHDAVRKGRKKLAFDILEAGAGINQQDSLGRTALHIAALSSNRKMFDWLKDRLADLRARDDYGWTPLKLLSYRSIIAKEA